ncbi:MAG: hypothetical protein ABDK87_01245 [Atribacterota bacterium]
MGIANINDKNRNRTSPPSKTSREVGKRYRKRTSHHNVRISSEKNSMKSLPVILPIIARIHTIVAETKRVYSKIQSREPPSG